MENRSTGLAAESRKKIVGINNYETNKYWIKLYFNKRDLKTSKIWQNPFQGDFNWMAEKWKNVRFITTSHTLNRSISSIARHFLIFDAWSGPKYMPESIFFYQYTIQMCADFYVFFLNFKF